MNDLSPSRATLWIIGGTGEAVTLATALAADPIPCLVTVTTEAARQAYDETPSLRVRVGPLPVASLGSFIQHHSIGAILDASHPFAVEISQGAMAAAQTLGLPYWRYERPTLAQCPDDIESSALPQPPLRRLIQSVANVDQVLTPEVLAGERVLLTLGYRWLGHFRPWHSRAKLFARILPSPTALEAALAAGFTPDRLIALRPPVGEALETALWQQWQITRVVTKASGQAGGEATKQSVAQRLGVSLVIINRPNIYYPTLTDNLDEVMAIGRRWWQTQKSPANF